MSGATMPTEPPRDRVDGRARTTAESLLGDLASEQQEVRALVEYATAAEWAHPTTPGWTVRDQVAHLGFFDDVAATSIQDPTRFSAMRRAALADIPAYEQKHLRAVPQRGDEALWTWEQASSRFQEAAGQADPRERLQWFGPDMGLLSMISARLMETWAHGYDIADGLGTVRAPTGRLRHVAGLAVRARAQGYVVRGLSVPEQAVRVELSAPDGALWTFGPPDAFASVRGTAEEFCLVLTRRRHVDDTDLIGEGDVAREWMEIGQAYAGPPGDGPARRPVREQEVR